MEGIEHISTFKTVTKFLVETAQNEILHGHREEFTRWKGRAGDFKAALLEEMKKYARQQYPFNNKVDKKHGIIVWWKALQGSDHAQILPVSALAIMTQRMAMLTWTIRLNSFSRLKYSQFVQIRWQRSVLSLRLRGLHLHVAP
jgi:hypothetical protein